jgi:TRAP-type uncharacterized transport system substrate-binding protein
MPTAFTKPFCGLAIALICLATFPAWSQRAGTSISTGREGGNYFEIGERLRAAMLLEHDFTIGLEASSGSIQNLARVADGSSPTGLALTQSDALSGFIRSNPGFADDFIVLGDAGRECVVLITSKKGGAASFSQLKAMPGAEISVDDLGSGASATFDHLVEMDPTLAKTKPVFVDMVEAMLQVKVGGAHTKLKAVMLVQRPSARSAAVEILLENASDYQLVPIRQSDVQNAKLPDDSVVYTFEKVRIGGGQGRATFEVETICTRSLLLASKEKLSRELRSQLSLVMLNSSKSIIGEDD